jgi:hypothetical protein
MRSIFDKGGADVVLVGMPSIEKRIGRFPKFYSRIDSSLNPDFLILLKYYPVMPAKSRFEQVHLARRFGASNLVGSPFSRTSAL